MDHISAHIKKAADKPRRPGVGVPTRASGDRVTERGELMQYFMERLNSSRVRDGLPKLTMPRMGHLLTAIPTKDLYYLKSVCDNAKDFSKKFWWEIDPKKHSDNNHAK
ncbi:MAG: hypothetical protein ABSE76_00560 [Minisyncoccia bacterium]|jgi:hypothetical protein